MVSCAQINKRVYLVAQNSSIHNVRLSKVNEIILCATRYQPLGLQSTFVVYYSVYRI